GLSIANGMALAARLDGRDSRFWCLLGDGELDEGQCWEAAMTAAHYGLDNLTAIVDRNRLQIDGDTEVVMALEPLSDKWKAFGFHVIDCDGHSFPDLRRAYAEARETKGKPTCIIAHTHKGRGVSFMTDQAGWHGRAPNQEELVRAVGEVCGCAPETPDCCLKLARGGGR
ncbi:MAG: thiamine pyrophosphate-dependent enzyme, partial [bacterium]|nr:thiamine pyrophosphate-dependent enzyme [bacterium]